MLVKDVFISVLLVLSYFVKLEIVALQSMYKSVPGASIIHLENSSKTVVHSEISCSFLCFKTSVECVVASFSKGESICILSASKFVEFSSGNTTNELMIYTSGSAYALQNKSSSWDQAKLNCEANGWHFLDIQTAAEQALLRDALPELIGSDTEGIWIGASKQNDQFVWSVGSAVYEFGWVPDRPTDVDGDDCVTMRPSLNYEWNNVKCSWKRRSLCELS